MEWISRCVNSLYSSSPNAKETCPDDCTALCLPPLKSEPLPAIQSTTTSDCGACTFPCAQHPSVPSQQLGIDQSQPLHNTVPAYAIHLVILTGKSDWPAHIEDEGLAQALIEAIHERRKVWKRTEANRYRSLLNTGDNEQKQQQQQQQQRILVTNASLPSTFSTKRGAFDVHLLPDNVVIANVTSRRAKKLLEFIYNRPNAEPFEVHPSPFDNLLLVCGHARKDKRCGTVGPMLKKALEDAVGMAGVSAEVALVSHLGGHAFAGNLVMYTHQGQRAIWYGRVTPCHCMDIIHQSIVQDRVIQDLLRAVFEVGCSRVLDW
ncbi:Sucrase/ferredoxin-like-domain-containing protein [Dichotomocladium elegans]|nr:Sucrase/ferredoxin-like-domain-containing protein [Dichotomocladium elegans]